MFSRSDEEEKSLSASFCPKLQDLLAESDFVVITCPHTPDTDGLFADEQFDAMKKTAVLVNVARGENSTCPFVKRMQNI